MGASPLLISTEYSFTHDDPQFRFQTPALYQKDQENSLYSLSFAASNSRDLANNYQHSSIVKISKGNSIRTTWC